MTAGNGAARSLSARKQMFVDAYLTGISAADAARSAGYAAGNVRHQGWRLLHRDKAVMAAVAERQAVVSAKAEVTAESLLQQLREDRQFARETKNATAMVRASEMIGKLTGLMVERRDVRQDQRLRVEIVRYGDAAVQISGGSA